MDQSTGTPVAIQEKLWGYCPDCKLTKPVEEFGKRGPVERGRLAAYCLSCYRARKRADYAQNRTRRVADIYDRMAARTHGVTASERDAMVTAQNGLCLICHEALVLEGKGRSVVDHDHASGKVRGILCAICNRGVGCFHDDPGRLRDAADYLERTQGA